MRQKFFILLALVTASTGFAGAAEGQLRPWEISIAGGPSFPVGDLADVAGTGYHVEGSVGFNVPLMPFGIRADALWQEFKDEEEGWFRQIGAVANATFGVPLVIIEPYALVNVSYLRTDSPEEAHEGHAHDGEAENIFGAGVGAGLEFPFMGLTGFLEARVLNLVGSGNATDFRGVPVTVGIRF